MGTCKEWDSLEDKVGAHERRRLTVNRRVPAGVVGLRQNKQAGTVGLDFGDASAIAGDVGRVWRAGGSDWSAASQLRHRAFNYSRAAEIHASQERQRALRVRLGADVANQPGARESLLVLIQPRRTGGVFTGGPAS